MIKPAVKNATLRFNSVENNTCLNGKLYLSGKLRSVAMILGVRPSGCVTT